MTVSQKEIIFVLKDAIIITAAAVITAFIINTVHPGGISLLGKWDASEGVISAEAKNKKIERKLEIEKVSEAAKIYKDSKAVFVDARTLDNYNDGRIKGALPFPAYEFNEYIDEFIEKVPRDTPVITYCSGRYCEDSHLLAQDLLASGYSNVRVFVDGFPGWEKAGLPVEGINQ
ncbi:MAG: rhodanese-like domain-containing protein [Fibrobacterota bacterium]